jgi:hypothetical protein
MPDESKSYCDHPRVLRHVIVDNRILGYCTECGHDVDVRGGNYKDTGEKQHDLFIYVSKITKERKGGILPRGLTFA